MSKSDYTVKAHLQAHHGALSKFLKGMHEQHMAASEHHGVLAKLHDGEIADHHKALAKSHESMAGHATQFDEANDDAMEMCDSLTKAMARHDNSIVPDRVAGIVRPVPRAGQREIADAEVPVEFDKMFSIEG